MTSIRVFALLIGLLLLNACSKDEPDLDSTNPPVELYFPPISGDSWDTTGPSSLSWNISAIDDLYNFLQNSNTRAFMILKDGKMVVEEYWGMNIAGTEVFDKDTNWYWASAGKTITSTLVGIAQEEGLLSIEDATSDYLGTGWTTMTSGQETQIKVKHQLMMTTGLDYTVDFDCTDPSCLQYRKDPGTQWFYHNAPYTLLKNVVEAASGTSYLNFTNTCIANKIGMSGIWLPTGDSNVYWSKPRDMARFGLMILNNGTWDDTPVLSDMNYYNQMVNTSQQLNPSYGYLWWLNGKDSHILPGLPFSYNIPFSSSAPDDLIIAAGKNGQFLCISPSQNLIVIRMGDDPDDSLVSNQYHDDMWKKVNAVIGE